MPENIWDFSAFAVERANEPVHEFAVPLTVDLLYDHDELFGKASQSLKFYSYDEAEQEWLESAVSLAEPGRFRVSLSHFSTQASTLDDVIKMPAVLDAAQVNPSTGAATFSYPIQIAPGVGSVLPQLQLTYNSASADESHAAAGWVGTGWDLSAPSISRSGDRYFLNLNGVGTEILEVDGDYVARSQRFWLVTRDCSTEDSCWTVRDTAGNTYVFGGDDDSRRFYNDFGLVGEQDYQWDLSLAMDAHGNETIYEYEQILGTWFYSYYDSPDPYVVSSYLKRITYPGGQVDLTLKNETNSPGWLEDASRYKTAPEGSYLQVRPDVRMCGSNFTAVIETQALHEIDVKSWDDDAFYTARSYVFEYEDVDADASCGQGTANLGHSLKSLLVRGQDDGSLHRIDFNNIEKQTSKICPHAGGGTSTWKSKRLEKVKNGFGGETTFTYASTPVSFPWPNPADIVCDGDDAPRFQHHLVTGVTQSAGTAWAGGQSPSVTQTFSYIGSPAWKTDGVLDTDNLYGIRSVFTGFEEVHVTDSEGNKNKHFFATTGEHAGTQVKQETWGHEATPVLWQSSESTPVIVTQTPTLTLQSITRASGRIAKATTSTYQEGLQVGEVIVVSGVDNGTYNGRFYNGAFKITKVEHDCMNWYTCFSTEFWYVMDGAPTANAQGTYKIAGRPVVSGVESTTTRAKGMSSSHGARVSYAYDTATGMVATTTEDGDISSTSNADCRVSVMTYVASLPTNAPRFILPSTSSVKGCGDGATPEAKSASFYDGSTSLSATPTKGNLTTSRQTVDIARASTDGEKYIYQYSSYFASGQPLAASVPMYGNEAAILSGGTEGTVPTTKGRTVLAYDLGSNDSIQTSLTGPGRFVTSTTTYVYEANGSAASPATQVTTTEWDPRLGVPKRGIDATGLLESRTFYDQFGRTTGTWRTLDSTASGTPVPAVEYAYSWGVPGTPIASPDGNNVVTVKQRPTSNTSTILEQHRCMDGLGRERHAVAPFGSGKALTQYTYDARGLQTNTQSYSINPSYWCFPGTDANYGPNNFTQYDPLGRPLTVTNSEPGTPVACPTSTTVGCSRVEYSNSDSHVLTTTFDENGHKTQSETDGLGRIVATRQYDDASTPNLYAEVLYTYDIQGNLLKVDPIAGSGLDDTVITYDALGRKLTMIDPDMSGYWEDEKRAPWTYRYDASGNLLEQTDARRAPDDPNGVGVRTTMTYDSLNRLKTKEYAQSNPTWTPDFPNSVPFLAVMRPNQTFLYDDYDESGDDSYCGSDDATAIGRLTKSTDGEITTKYCYDVRGREINRKLKIAPNNTLSGCTGWSVPYETARTYDVGDRLETLEYPDGETLEYDYKDTAVGGGQLDTISSSLATYVSSTSYHVSGQPSSVTSSNGMVTTYDRDARYRLSKIKTVLSSTTKQELANYEYDRAGNIKRINDTVAGENQTFDYDFLDRLTKMTINGSSTPTASYTYNAGTVYGGKIGNMTSKTEGSTTALNYTAEHMHAVDTGHYDKNGNAILLGQDLYAFDVENRVYAISNFTGAMLQTNYAYDVGGEMAFRRTTSWYYAGVDTKYTYMDGIYQQRFFNCGAPVETTKFYAAFGRSIAIRTGSTLNYLLADHLGSTTGQMDSSGNVSALRYYPFGTLRSGSPQTDRMYTGQSNQMNGLGSAVYYYHARFYSPQFAHFVSADTLEPMIDGHSSGRYAYVFGNPIRRSDPLGNVPCLDCSPQYSSEEVANFFAWAYQMISAGYQILPRDAGLFLFGTATANIYVLGNKDMRFALGGGALFLAAGTYLLQFDAGAILRGDSPAATEGTLTVNSETTAFDWITGQRVNFMAAAFALTLAAENGYLHYTNQGAAEKIVASRQLLSPNGPGGDVFVTRDIYFTGADAKEKLGLDPSRTVDAVVGLVALAPLSGRQAAPNLETGLPAGGFQFVGESPFPILPVFVIHLLK